MSPQAIVDTDVQENLRIITIVDDNEIGNVQAAMTAGSAVGVLVIPAVELSTPEGLDRWTLSDKDKQRWALAVKLRSEHKR